MDTPPKLLRIAPLVALPSAGAVSFGLSSPSNRPRCRARLVLPDSMGTSRCGDVDDDPPRLPDRLPSARQAHPAGVGRLRLDEEWQCRYGRWSAPSPGRTLRRSPA